MIGSCVLGKGWSVSLADPSRVAGLITSQLAQGGGFRLPLLEAVRSGAVRLVHVNPGATVPARLLAEDGAPAVVCLGADGMVACGPDRFPDCARLLAWARFAVLHAAAGEAWHYSLAVDAACRWRRLVLIEAGSSEEGRWVEALDCDARRRRAAGVRDLGGVRISALPCAWHPAQRGVAGHA